MFKANEMRKKCANRYIRYGREGCRQKDKTECRICFVSRIGIKYQSTRGGWIRVSGEPSTSASSVPLTHEPSAQWTHGIEFAPCFSCSAYCLLQRPAAATAAAGRGSARHAQCQRLHSAWLSQRGYFQRWMGRRVLQQWMCSQPLSVRAIVHANILLLLHCLSCLSPFHYFHAQSLNYFF